MLKSNSNSSRELLDLCSLVVIFFIFILLISLKCLSDKYFYHRYNSTFYSFALFCPNHRLPGSYRTKYIGSNVDGENWRRFYCGEDSGLAGILKVKDSSTRNHYLITSFIIAQCRCNAGPLRLHSGERAKTQHLTAITAAPAHGKQYLISSYRLLPLRCITAFPRLFTGNISSPWIWKEVYRYTLSYPRGRFRRGKILKQYFQ